MPLSRRTRTRFGLGLTMMALLSALGLPITATADEQHSNQDADRAATEDVAPEAADDPGDDQDEPLEVTVRGERQPPRAASAVTVTGGELKLRPRLRPADILEVAPGLLTVQHAGGGKANQYFLRGFDIDHGTDLALFVDGVPVNMVSHGHGQGYADMHFLIPELVSSLQVHKGPYDAQFGDFATAGAVNMELCDAVHESQVSFTAGQYGIFRGLGIVSRDVGASTRFLIAGEAYTQDGPFENEEDLRRFNVTLRATHDLTSLSSLTATWMSYSGRWNASGQLPLREVEAGRLDRFGTLDPFEGGETQRHSGQLRYQARADEAEVDVLVYGVRYNWALFSNFTFFLEDQDHGDMIEQTDDRSLAGIDARTRFHHHLGPLRLETSLGVQGRVDGIDNALHHDRQRERLSTSVDAHINQTAIGLFLDERAQLTDWLTVIAGVRLDRADVSVDDRLDDLATVGDSDGGSAGATLASPKGSVILSPRHWLDLFVNVGRGFHSNDARGAVRSVDPATLLVPATGYEVGVRAAPWQPLTVTAAAYRLDLDSEQVYVGDAGTTEPSDPTTRMGIELAGRLYFGRWLFADAAATFNEAAFRPNSGNAGSVALAPTRTVTAGVGFRAPFGTFGSIRLRHIGPRPATEDERIIAEGWTILDARLGHRLGPAELALDAQNLINTQWREVQFATESQLQNEAAPVEEIHFAPGWPFTFRATLTAYF